MNRIVVFLPDNRKLIIKSGSVQPDPQFLIVLATDGKYKFPWANVYGVFTEKEN